MGKNSIIRAITLLFILTFGMGSGHAQMKEVFDSIYYKSVSDSVERYIKSHPNRFKPEQNKFKPNPIATIGYTEEDGFGFFLGVIGQYRNGFDTLAPLSTLSAIGYISTKAAFRVALGGINYLQRQKSRIEYRISTYYDTRRFWGIGYEEASQCTNESRYSEFGVEAVLKYRFLVSPIFNIAPVVGYKYYKAKDFSKEELIDGHFTSFNGFHLGVDLVIDTRDNPNNPHRGININLNQKIYPQALYNSSIFYQTTFVADFYIEGWEGGIFAIDLFSESNYGDSPWFVWTPIGGENRMRGYYLGKYRDRNTLALQLELRQTLYKGHGAVIWGGAANIFPTYREINLRNTLPNYGIGYRYDLAGNIFKLDIGFGKYKEWGIIAGFNHAF